MLCEIQNPDNENLGFYLVVNEGTLDVFERGTMDLYCKERVLSNYSSEDRFQSREGARTRKPVGGHCGKQQLWEWLERYIEGSRSKMLTVFLVQPEAALIATPPKSGLDRQ